MSFDTFSSY